MALPKRLYCGNCIENTQNTNKLTMALAAPTKQNLMNLCRKGCFLICLRMLCNMPVMQQQK
jgi:hypothetical protein